MSASRLHVVLAVVWAVAAVPTVIWLRDSVLWVALMSVYNLVVTHMSAHQAARAAEAERRLEEEVRKKTPAAPAGGQ